MVTASPLHLIVNNLQMWQSAENLMFYRKTLDAMILKMDNILVFQQN